MELLNCEQKNLLSELIHGLNAAKQLQAQFGADPSSSYSSYLTTEMKETLLHQIVSSYKKAILMVNTTQHNPTTETVVTADLVSGKVPESPTSITGSPGSEEFLDGSLSSRKR